MRHRGARGACAAAAFVLAIVGTARAAERYVDSDEAKDTTSNKNCVLTDLSGLEASEQITWVWIAPGAKLGGPGKIQIAAITNQSDVTDTEIGDSTKKAFEQAFTRVGKTVGTGGLTLKSCIYWMERADASKAFNPFGGAYTAQAGVGIEGEVVDASGKPVMRFRHWGRQSGSQKEAASQVVDDVANFTRDH